MSLIGFLFLFCICYELCSPYVPYRAPLPWQHWSPGNQAFGEGSLVNSTKTLSPTSTTACPCNDDGSGDETREWDKRFLQLGTIVLLALICFTLFILCVCLLRALAIQEFANGK